MTGALARAAQWDVGTSTSLITPDRDGIAACRQAGFDCMEVVLRGTEPDPVAAAAPAVRWAAEVGLRLHSVHLPYGWQWDVSQPDDAAREHAIVRHMQLLDEAAAWRPTAAVLHPSYEPIPDDDRKQRLAHCRDSLARLSRHAHGLGIQLCVECLPRTCLGNTGEEILYLVHGAPGLGVCCDVNHLFHETPQQFIRQVGEHIATVHISDNDGVDERHWLPGRGVIDWQAVIIALAETGYNGPFMFEARGKGDVLVTPDDVMAWWRQTVG